MNRYGVRALEHWEKWLPERFREISHPQTYFSTLGEEIEQKIDELSQHLAGDDPPGEDYIEKLGRLNMARRDAEEQVMREMGLIDAEESSSQ
jgi:hypothetical protein